MDALFGLPRKTNAGKSYRPPLFGDTMFMDQHVVDEFVAAESTRKHQIKVMHELHCRINKQQIFLN